MLNYTLVVDQVADLDPIWLKQHKHEVIVIPIPVTEGSESYFDFTPDTFYPYLLQARARNAHVNSAYADEAAYQTFLKLFKKEKPFIYLGMTSTLSATFRNNVGKIERLRSKYPRTSVNYVDSCCIAPGYRLLVERLVESEIEFRDVLGWVYEERDKITHLFTFDDFTQARYSGRFKVGDVKAFLISALNIRPYMRFDYFENEALEDELTEEEKALGIDKLDPEVYELFTKQLRVSGKCRGDRHIVGKFAQEIVARIATPEQRAEDPTKGWIIISYAMNPNLATMLREKLTQILPDENFVIKTGRIGPVIGSHVGESTMAVFFTAREASSALKRTWQQYQP